ncbi:TraC family protein [Thiobacillus sp.]
MRSFSADQQHRLRGDAYRVLLSVTMPVKDVEYRTLERIIALRDAQVSKLKTYYQFERVWGAEDLMAWVRTMLSPAQHSADPVCYDDGQALRYQVITLEQFQEKAGYQPDGAKEGTKK